MIQERPPQERAAPSANRLLIRPMKTFYKLDMKFLFTACGGGGREFAKSLILVGFKGFLTLQGFQFRLLPGLGSRELLHRNGPFRSRLVTL
jgi:hypothetical protein